MTTADEKGLGMPKFQAMLRDTAGALIVELAFVLPMVFMFTIGAVELAMYVYHANAAAKATQLGVRWAVENPPISTTLRNHIASTSWWAVGTLGKNCRDVLPNGQAIVCLGTPGGQEIRCTSTNADCSLTAILTEMRRVYPQLDAGDVQVIYTPFDLVPGASELGFVGRPGGVPINVTVRIPCARYNLLFLRNIFNWASPSTTPKWPSGADGTQCPAGVGFLMPPTSAQLTSESFGPPT